MAANSNICEIKYKQMKATALGVWYVQIPYGYIVNPQGEVVEAKEHNGSFFVWVDRKRRPIWKLPKLKYKDVMDFKEIFCGNEFNNFKKNKQ